MDAVSVDADVQNIDNIFNDLTECQRYNRQIVSFQTQNRNTDEDTKYRRYRRTDKERQNEAYLVACDHIFHGMIKKCT